MKKLKITNNSPAILGFALVSLGVLILNILTGGKSNQLLFMTWHSSLKSPLTYLRFFTHILGHSSWSHYIGNMAYILLLGPMLEEKYGSQKILEVMGITALVTALVLVTAGITGLVNYIFFPAVALCGASGVVFAFILLTSFTSFRAGELPVTVILVALIYLGQQVYEGIFLQDNISNLSHIIGGIIGAAIGYRLNVKKR